MVNKVKIDYPNQSVNIESRYWGLVGNHEIIQLTSTKECDTVIFYTDQIFYRKTGDDSLVIYVSGSSYSEKQSSLCDNIDLDIHDLKSYDDIREMERTYKSKGLERITIY